MQRPQMLCIRGVALATFLLLVLELGAQPLQEDEVRTSVLDMRQTIARSLESASVDFKVPLQILQAIAFHQSRWTQSVPTGESDVPAGYGVMGLRDDQLFGRSAAEAAQMIDRPLQHVKENTAANIRGAAALLASYADDERARGVEVNDNLETWLSVIQRFSGIRDPQLATDWTYEVFDVITKGHHEAGIDISQRAVNLPALARPEAIPSATVQGYPGATWKGTNYNYTPGPRSSASITRIVIHTIVLNGTSWSAQGALSSFKQTDSAPARTTSFAAMVKSGRLSVTPM